MGYAWTCACCGWRFDDLITSIACRMPDDVHDLSEEERTARALTTEDFCTLDGDRHFVRSVLEVPITGSDAPFLWGVWAAVSHATIRRAGALFDVGADESEPRPAAILANRVHGYPGSLGLRGRLRFRPLPDRPRLLLEPGDHPLALDQRQGITVARVQEIIRPFVHH